jgi:urease subunit alpha
LIIKGGFITHGRHGRPERVDPHAAAGVTVCLARSGGAVTRRSLTFVSKWAERIRQLRTGQPLSAVNSIRGVRKQHMVHNACRT